MSVLLVSLFYEFGIRSVWIPDGLTSKIIKGLGNSREISNSDKLILKDTKNGNFRSVDHLRSNRPLPFPLNLSPVLPITVHSRTDPIPRVNRFVVSSTTELS